MSAPVERRIPAGLGALGEALRVVEGPEGPARRAGLREGDRIASIDGDPVRTLVLEEVVERLRGPVGSEVELEIVRDGELVTLVVPRAPYDR